MESTTLQQLQAKRKKMKHNLCYVGLVILIILLITPPMLRLFVEDKTGEEVVKKVYIALVCSKEGESISSTFEDGKPQNIMYRIQGNVTNNTPDEIDDINNDLKDSTIEETPTPSISNANSAIRDTDTVIGVLARFSSFEYNAEENYSELKISYSSFPKTEDYDAVFATISAQENFYTSRGFSCTQNTF